MAAVKTKQNRHLAPSPKAAVLPEKPAFVAPPKVPLSPDRIAELKSHDDMEQLLFIAARYIGRPLTSTEIGNILYYYDSLLFARQVITLYSLHIYEQMIPAEFLCPDYIITNH